jgi:hypothetical protein
MPPRYAYWTILIDNAPTAFRARAPEELLPTLNQLRRTNSNIVMKWFARGRLWDSPEAERAAMRSPKKVERRGQDWRPGGQHKDPRARPPRDVRRAKYAARQRTGGHWGDERRGDKGMGAPSGRKPWRDRRAAGFQTAPHGKPSAGKAGGRDRPGPANRPRQGYAPSTTLRAPRATSRASGPPKRSAKAEAGRDDRPGPPKAGHYNRTDSAKAGHHNRPGSAEARNHNRPGPDAAAGSDRRKRRDDEPPDRD